MDPKIRAFLMEYLDLCLADNTKARRLDKQGKYHHIHDEKAELNSQEELMKRTIGSDETLPQGTMKPAHKGIVFDTKYKAPSVLVSDSEKKSGKKRSKKTSGKSVKKSKDKPRSKKKGNKAKKK